MVSDWAKEATAVEELRGRIHVLQKEHDRALDAARRLLEEHGTELDRINEKQRLMGEYRSLLKLIEGDT